MRAVHVAANSGQPSSMYLSLAGAVFVIPFLLVLRLLRTPGGRGQKRKVLISVKVFEIFVMLLGLAAFFSTRIELMLLVLFLMALHSTIFSPAKYGIVPEMLPDQDLSRANGLLEMSTFVAIVLGTSIGSFLFAAWKNEPWKMGVVTLAVAIAGFLTSLKITRVPPAGTIAPFQIESVCARSSTGTKHLLKRSPPVAYGARHLLFLVPGRAVPNGFVAVRQRGSARDRSESGTAGDGSGDRNRRGQHAGGTTLGRQSGVGAGAARRSLDGRLLYRACMRREALMRSR